MRKTKMNLSAVFIGVFSILAGILLVLALYHSLKRFSMRVSADFYYPFLSAAASVENFVANQNLALKDKKILVHELTVLQQENTELVARAALIHQLQEENEQLKQMLFMKSGLRFEAVFAETMLRDPVTWSKFFTINKGEADGIRVGDPVMAMTPRIGNNPGVPGMIGRIRSVSKHTAVVTTLFGEGCSVSVMLQESRSTGVLSGQQDQDARQARSVTIDHLKLDARYGIGEVVVTSGFSTQTPQGLYLGKLEPFPDGSAAHESKDKLYAKALLRPAVNIDTVRFVAVLTTRGNRND